MKSLSWSNRWKILLGPSLAVGLCYGIVVHRPLHRSVQQERAKLQRLQSIAGRSNVGTQPSLAELQAETKELQERLEATRQFSSHLVSKRADLRAEWLSSTTPASELARLLERVEKAGLSCIACEPLTAQDSGASTRSSSLQAMAEQLGASPSDLARRREVKITLRGRFDELQQFLRQLKSEPLGLYITALDMAAGESDTRLRSWVLTISV